ncbi:flagellar basal body P-ring formation chaperone FlgA [Thalassobius sp. S69A]|uniref:flagellar basal body P-ring formation chaperone FlgA n=1 Tax=unclassified Thalassovita TaxID=2619711 RepID=UPI000C0F3524|nr:flagella basal body P-ring formation protein FlgA [Paracoccaceae bacterium]MBT26125.1 flagella basal body P-ring formation protein FlgA [Paracoccaceae bacterium]
MRTILALLILATPVQADVVLAARTLRPQTIVTAADLVVKGGTIPGVIEDPAALLGMETRVALYAGRPIRPGDVGPPAIIERNQIVLLTFNKGGLSIQAEGRALARAGAGDRVRVMNLESRSTIWGFAQPDGSVLVK